MNKILALACGILMVPSFSFAQEADICADGAGTIVKGAITEHEYCKSNTSMNWWNAVAWCDALGRPMFKLDDCACSASTNCIKSCSELISNIHVLL